MKQLLPLLLLLICSTLLAQIKTIAPKPAVTKFIGTIQPLQLNKFKAKLMAIDCNCNEQAFNYDHLWNTKQKLNQQKFNPAAKKATASLDITSTNNTQVVAPTIGRNFDAGSYGCPPDNAIAISNSGDIISIYNSNLTITNENGTTNNTITLINFFSNSTISNILCDPKVIYDPNADRFIVEAQTCDRNNLIPSGVLIAFSQTNDPNGLWNLYQITNNNYLFDYPKMAITQSRLILTGNLFDASGTFQQSIIYSISTSDGYSNVSQLNTLSWNAPEYRVVPAKFANLPNSDNIYLITTPNTTNLHIYNINNGSLFDDGYVSVNFPQPPADAAEMGTSLLLNTGSSAIQDAVCQNQMLHVVHCVGDANNYSEIRYYRIIVNGNVPTLTNTSDISYTTVKDYCYPAIHSFSNSSFDQSVYISFSAAGPSAYPEIRGKFFDGALNTFSSDLIRQGDGAVLNCADPQHNNNQRWGDYSGIAKKYSATTPTLWVAGCYGNSSGDWNTYVAEIINTNPDVNLNSGAKPLSMQPQTLHVYPNPAINSCKIEFEKEDISAIQVDLFDLLGKKIDHIFTGQNAQGKNLLQFSTTDINNGVYLITISSSNKIIYNEKIVVNH